MAFWSNAARKNHESQSESYLHLWGFASDAGMPNAKNVDKQVGEIGTTIVGIQANRSATSIIFLDKWHFTHLKSLSNLGKSPVVSNHHSSDVFGTGIGTIFESQKAGCTATPLWAIPRWHGSMCDGSADWWPQSCRIERRTLLSTRLQRCVWKLPGAAEIVDAACFFVILILWKSQSDSNVTLRTFKYSTDFNHWHQGIPLRENPWWPLIFRTFHLRGRRYQVSPAGASVDVFRGWTAARAGYCWGKARWRIWRSKTLLRRGGSKTKDWLWKGPFNGLIWP